jgi:predicted metalloendopeptidase
MIKSNNIQFVLVYGKVMIERGSHSLPEFRVNGPLSNMKEFANDWSCAADTNMNPKEKCEIW